VNPESLFKFVCSPFEAAKLPSPNLVLSTPTECSEVFIEQKIEEERLSPTRVSSSGESFTEFETVKYCCQSRMVKEIDFDFE
jgi:hypothetical protein